MCPLENSTTTTTTEALVTATRLVFETIWASAPARDDKGNVIMNEDVLVTILERAGLSAADAEACVEDATSSETK
jgi:hypothetical protein